MNAFTSIDFAEAKRAGAIADRLLSDHEGEVLAAANMLAKALGKHGLRIGEVIERGLHPPQLPPPPPPVDLRRRRSTGVAAHVVRAGNCLMRAHLYSPKELKFLREIRNYRTPSGKQVDWLHALSARWADGEGEF